MKDFHWKWNTCVENSLNCLQKRMRGKRSQSLPLRIPELWIMSLGGVFLICFKSLTVFYFKQLISCWLTDWMRNAWSTPAISAFSLSLSLSLSLSPSLFLSLYLSISDRWRGCAPHTLFTIQRERERERERLRKRERERLRKRERERLIKRERERERLR